MDKQQTLKAACRTLGLTHTRETLEKILHDAEKEGWSYLDFLVFVTDSEILFKQEKAKNKRIKEAGFPYPKCCRREKTFSQAPGYCRVRIIAETRKAFIYRLSGFFYAFLTQH